MNLGLIISMYNEIDTTSSTIQNLKNDLDKIIVIQSDPGKIEKKLDESLPDHYELLPDIASSSENYKNEREQGGLTTVPAKALSRNCSKGFKISNSFDVDWWIFIMGDVLIENLEGIKKIIEKMQKQNQTLAITRPVGQTLYDSHGKLTHLVTSEMTTFMPTFFIVHSDLIKKGLFTDITVTNPYASEQCFGDNLKQFSKNQNLDLFDFTLIINDDAYPDFIKGLKYNVPTPKTPKFLRPLKKFLKK